MAKFKFGAPPKTFKRTVKFTSVDGVNETLDVTFHFRSRKEYGVFFDSMRSAAKNKGLDKEDVSMTDVMEILVGNSGEFMLQAIDSWELEDELSEANLDRLADQFPGVAAEIMEVYKVACLEGKPGN